MNLDCHNVKKYPNKRYGIYHCPKCDAKFKVLTVEYQYPYSIIYCVCNTMFRLRYKEE